jgi:hypothetical protein
LNGSSTYSGLLNQLKRYFEGLQIDKGSASRDTISRTELESALSEKEFNDALTKYVLSLIDKKISEEAESYISSAPMSFLHSITEFIDGLAHLDRGNIYTKDLMAPFFNQLLSDFGPRLETGGLTSGQVKKIRDAEKRFNQGANSDLGFSTRLSSSAVAKDAEKLFSRMYAEFTISPRSHKDRIQFLQAVDALINFSKFASSFAITELDFLVLFLDDLKRSAIIGSGGRPEIEFGSLSKLRSQIETALLDKLRVTAPEHLADNTSNMLLELGMSAGAKPESFGLAVVNFYSSPQPLVALNSRWWKTLSLGEILDICKSSSTLREAIRESDKREGWLNETVLNFLAEAGSLHDLSIAFDSNTLFGKPDVHGVTKIWKSLSAKSDLLGGIEAVIIEEPLAEAKRAGKDALQKTSKSFEEQIEKLIAEVTKLKGDLRNIDSAIVRSQESLGGSKAEMEAGISKRYSEALGRLIRRVEREAAKTPIPALLAKESNSLSRLGIQLLVSGTEVSYDINCHDAIGYNPEIGDRVVIVETGVLLAIGDTRITVLKALVRPAS